MPTFIVILLAKLSAIASKLLGRGDGSALPGLIAERLRPGILSELGRQLKGNVIVVTGTNGKTTTTRMVTAIAASKGARVLTNRAGSNLTRGILSTMILAASWSGRIRESEAVFEIDEAAFASAIKALMPKAVVVLNLFRDQLDRYGELNTLAAQMKAALGDYDGQLILNSDDPLVASLGLDQDRATYFGLDSAKVKPLAHDFAADSNSCPVCGSALKYKNIFYAHIGKYSCPKHDFIQPSLNVVGNTTKVSLEGSTTTISAGGEKGTLDLELPGLYNAYNALAALAVGLQLGTKLSDAISTIETMPAAYGRAERVKLDGHNLQLLLVKNPTGFNQVIQTYLASKQTQPLLILINDLIADGRDVSWLWDVAIEDLPKQVIVVSGSRAYDMALRLKYADLVHEVQLSPQKALDKFLLQVPKGQSGLILPTYTAMVAVRKQLATRGAEGLER